MSENSMINDLILEKAAASILGIDVDELIRMRESGNAPTHTDFTFNTINGDTLEPKTVILYSRKVIDEWKKEHDKTTDDDSDLSMPDNRYMKNCFVWIFMLLVVNPEKKISINRVYDLAVGVGMKWRKRTVHTVMVHLLALGLVGSDDVPKRNRFGERRFYATLAGLHTGKSIS